MKYSNKYIDRIARKFQKNPKAKAKTESEKEAKKFAKKIEQYKKMTGKKRISTSVREDLHEFTPKQIVNEAKGKKLLNRIEAYEKKYGQADMETINDLASVSYTHLRAHET